jgi:hypothetical protein
MIPSVHWSLDGKPVDFAWSRAGATLGGYDSCSGVIPESQAGTAQQDSLITGWTENGDPVWEGRLAQDPYVTNGLASFSARGHKAEAEERFERVLFQSRDITDWSDATGPPFNLTPGLPAALSFSNVITLFAENSEGGTKTYTAKLGFWAPGHVGGITRYAYDVQGTPQSFSIVVKRGIGPDGGLTTIATHNGSPVDQTVATNTSDMLIMEVSMTLVPSGAAKLDLMNLRVNGIGTTDSLTTADVMTELGARLGWDTSGVFPSSTMVLPFDLVGNWVSDGFDYLAGIDDRFWRVTRDKSSTVPKLHYAPFGDRTWDVTLAADATPEIAPLPRYNRVVVHYQDNAGTPRSFTLTASPDPLARYKLVHTYPITLPDRQPDTTLPEAVAATLLPRVSAKRYGGRLQITGTTAGDIFAVLPGDEVRIGDWGPSEAQRFRIHEVEWSPEGATLGLEQPASAASLISKTLLGRRAGMLPVSMHAQSSRRFPLKMRRGRILQDWKT